MIERSKNISQELPVAFLLKMADLLGAEYDEFLSSLNQPAKAGLRVNTLKIPAQEFKHISPYPLSPVPWCAAGFTIDEYIPESMSLPPGKHPYHHAGLYYLQEPSAMAAAQVLAPQPGEVVLDLAAAPGGKSTHLAELMKNTGLLVANDIHPDRVWDLAENLERCGVTNAIVMNETPLRLAEHFGEYFDRIMLDAPCSGEGMFRKSEHARKEWKPELPVSCALRQSAILEQAARLVKPGGSLAYTTCTFSPEENEAVISSFMDKHGEFTLKAVEPSPGMQHSRPEWIGQPGNAQISRAVRIWPQDSPGEGHFIALLVKTEVPEILQPGIPQSQASPRPRKARLKEMTSILKLLNGFLKSCLNISFERGQIELVGSYIYRLPDGSPDLDGLKVIHPGWWLGTIQKERFTPSHALAMAIRADQARQTIPLRIGDQRIMSYLAGESFTHPGENSWVLVTVDGFPVGWGKRVRDVVKNYYPRGLRRIS